MDDPWDEPDDDQAPPGTSPGGAYPLPEATLAGDAPFLAGLAAAILGVLLFWRRRRREEEQ